MAALEHEALALPRHRFQLEACRADSFEERVRLLEERVRLLESTDARLEPGKVVQRRTFAERIAGCLAHAHVMAERLLRLVEPPLVGQDLALVVRERRLSDDVAGALHCRAPAAVSRYCFVPAALVVEPDAKVVQRPAHPAEVGELFEDRQCELAEGEPFRTSELVVAGRHQVVRVCETTAVACLLGVRRGDLGPANALVELALAEANPGGADLDVGAVPEQRVVRQAARRDARARPRRSRTPRRSAPTRSERAPRLAQSRVSTTGSSGSSPSTRS